jgi:hypothetical protein
MGTLEQQRIEASAYHAALCAQLISLQARFDALVCYVLNTDFQLEARITLKQIEAIQKAIDDNAEAQLK